MNHFAINIMSFDRPEYLGQVLASVRWNDLTDCDVHLYQDNAVNKFSHNRYAEDSKIQECMDIFIALFPKSTIHMSGDNVGIGIMYQKAEELSFLHMGYEAAIFLEDDFVPSPDYIRIMKALYQKTKDNPKIGSLTAYGPDKFATLNYQRMGEFSLVPAIPSWGFMLSENQWKKRQPYYQDYFDLIEKVDYRLKDDKKILAWHTLHGFNIGVTSQDAAHSIAYTLAGQVRLGTETRNAIYIGAHGLHFSPKQYRDGYYGRDPVWNYGDSLDFFQIPSDKELDLQLENIRKKKLA